MTGQPILVLGGHGGFGGRIARRVADPGHRVFAANVPYRSRPDKV